MTERLLTFSFYPFEERATAVVVVLEGNSQERQIWLTRDDKR